MTRQIRTSAKAVIIQNGKLLAIKVNEAKRNGIFCLAAVRSARKRFHRLWNGRSEKRQE